jgi:tetratricopeptide (TPR) repeat protein
VAVSYDALGEYAKAIDYYEQRLAIARMIQDSRVEDQVLGSLKVAYFAIGDYTKAAEYAAERQNLSRN